MKIISKLGKLFKVDHFPYIRTAVVWWVQYQILCLFKGFGLLLNQMKLTK